MAYLKPQSPLQHKDGDYFYPLTTVDQVVMEDGSRLNSVFKHTIITEATLLASNWSASAPYTQTINIEETGIDSELNIDVNVVYSGNQDTDSILNMNASYLTYTKINGNNITFYCLSKKPQVNIPIEIKGTCTNSIANIENNEENDNIKLNFDVVRYNSEEELLNATPKENTIGVVTDIPITGYYFCATQPEIMSQGEIWINTGTKSIVEFDVIDRITIYPIFVKQYIDNDLISKIVKTYQNNEWINWWTGELFKDGDEYISITGGWVAIGKGFSDDATGITTEPSITNDGTTLTMKSLSKVGGGAMYYTKNLIDLRDYTQLIFDGIITGAASSSSQCNMRVWPGPNLPEYTEDSAAYIRGNNMDGTLILDISNCNDENGYFVGFGTYSDPPIITMRSMILK